MLNEAELKLLKSAIRMNMIVMAIAFGLLAGGVLWLGTVILLLRGGYDVGMHLSAALGFPARVQRHLVGGVDRLGLGLRPWGPLRGHVLLELCAHLARAAHERIARYARCHD